jgi:GNAT superfamily N-acetyltransferase
VRSVWIEDRDWLADTMRQRWDGLVISRGEVLEPARLPALVAVDRGGLRLGALTFRPRPGSSDSVETEVVTVDALQSGRGAGSLLLDAAGTLAQRLGWRRLWLVTTNDNTAALRFYQRTGWDLVGFHRNALARSRALKPSIPQMGLDSIPIRHELELELPMPRTLIERDPGRAHRRRGAGCFHVVRVTSQVVDDVRRRVPQRRSVTGHKDDPATQRANYGGAASNTSPSASRLNDCCLDGGRPRGERAMALLPSSSSRPTWPDSRRRRRGAAS